MRQTFLFAFLVAAVMTASAQAQVGSPGIEYGNTIAAGDGVQLYPYDQQDPWLHGHFQRVPAYGGFSSFRPYNYRHVLAQTQLAQSWGHTHGMPYSQQFWNRYRGSYLEGNLHAGNQPMMQNPQAAGDPSQLYPAQVAPQQQSPMQGNPSQRSPDNTDSERAVRPIGYQTQDFSHRPSFTSEPDESSIPAERPIHVFPERMNKR